MRGARARAGVAAAALAVWLLGASPEGAHAQARVQAQLPSHTRPRSGRSAPKAAPSAARAPTGPPLSAGAGGADEPSSGQDQFGPDQGESDPLVANGLGSPLCGSASRASLSPGSRQDCEASGFIAAPAPTGDYGLDVHIDAGIPAVSTSWIYSVVQDLFVAPLWTALVWAVQALIVMFEWCYTLDLLASASALGLGARLRQIQSALTQPWLASVLAIAAVLAAYNGLVRRRVAQTLGEALVMLAMMAAGMWVVLDPTGTVGALAGWANQASLGTLSTTAKGTPVAASRSLADSMGVLFATVVEAPWCYLEFGNVTWCRDPSQLDPRLRGAGLKIAANELSLVGCASGSKPDCVQSSSAQGQALTRSARLLRSARSNAAIVLALPANGAARNSINEQGSLLRTLCRSSAAEACHGATAAQAQFRTAGHTIERVVGLALIVVGAAGMLMLLGFIVLRLLSAALLSLLYLLLAPAAILAPALGDAGRAAFRSWLSRLLTAVVSKLVYSFLLGVVLAVVEVLGQLQALGWWTQWLLMSAFWWGAFMRRHHAFGLADGSLSRRHTARPHSLARRVGGALDAPLTALRLIGLLGRADARMPPGEGAVPELRAPRGVSQIKSALASQAIDREQAETRARIARQDAIEARIEALRTQRERVIRARSIAVLHDQSRRVALLRARTGRIEQEIADGERRAGWAQQASADDQSKPRS